MKASGCDDSTTDNEGASISEDESSVKNTEKLCTVAIYHISQSITERTRSCSLTAINKLNVYVKSKNCLCAKDAKELELVEVVEWIGD